LVGLAGDRKMGEGSKKRSWKLHWQTWLVLFCVGGSLVVENLTEQDMVIKVNTQGEVIVPEGFENRVPIDLILDSVRIPLDDIKYLNIFETYTGWPFDFRYKGITNIYQPGFKPLIFAINILIALAILASSAFTSESYFRRQAKWHQYSLQFILAITTFVALLLANGKYDLVRWRGDETWEYIPFFFIAMGLWCVFWTAWRLVGLGVGRIGGGLDDG